MADFRQKKRIGDMLLEAGIITQEQLEDASHLFLCME